MREFLLAIDLGTSSSKVLAVDFDGKIASKVEAGYPIHRPQSGYAEQDPADWWNGVTSAVRKVVSNLSPEQHHIVAVGLSGQMHGTVLLDESGRLLAPAVIWPDQRSQSQVKEITTLFGLQGLINIAGSSIFTGFQASTVRWFQQEEPEIWSKVKSILTPKDWLRWRLTGEKFSEPSDGSGTLLLNVHRREWSQEILEKLNIDAALLPPIRGSREICGYLQEAPAEELNIPAGTPVIAGAADTACSILGAGISDEKALLITISSGGQLIVPISQVILDTSGRVHTFCSALEREDGRQAWYLMAAILSAGLSLRWLRDKLLRLEGSQAYQKMTEWGAESPAGARGLIFLPYLSGERTPHMDPQARGIFLGLTSGHGRSELIRAVMEGVAFACYHAFSSLFDLGIRPNSIILAGGGARSGLWQQIFADLFGLPVTPLMVEDQSALGAAMLAASGVGLIDLNEAVNRWRQYGPPVKPDNSKKEIYRPLFSIYKRAYNVHRDDFRILSAMSNGEISE
ncbi:MAG: xylulokinase [Anaerolineae bacterium]|nr:MAG: xylulokinase [Anaerolineae bacterium]